MGGVLNKYFASVFTNKKDMEDSEIGQGYADILGHVNIKEEELDLLKCIKVYISMTWWDRSNVIETRPQIDGALTEIFASSVATLKSQETGE